MGLILIYKYLKIEYFSYLTSPDSCIYPNYFKIVPNHQIESNTQTL